VCRTVWIVFNAFHFRWDSVFVTLEIHNAVVMLVTTTFVTGSDVTVVVTARFLVLGFQQRGVRFTFVEVITGNFDDATLTGRRWFHLDDCHD
jgi:hypothetical protein